MAERGDYGAQALMLAREAKMQISNHELVCAERYDRIAKNQEEAKSERQLMHQDNKTALEHISGRVDRLYNRAWAVAAFVITAEGGVIVGIIAWFMNRMMTQGGHP